MLCLVLLVELDSGRFYRFFIVFSRVSIAVLTRAIDIAILSVRLSRSGIVSNFLQHIVARSF